MKSNHFAFIDESGVIGGNIAQQPFFAVGMLKIQDTSEMNEELMKLHYDYFSSQKEKRNLLKKELFQSTRPLSFEDVQLLLLSTRHHEYKFTNITPTTLKKYKAFTDTAFKFPFQFSALVIDKTSPQFQLSHLTNYWEAYIEYTKKLCEKNYKASESVCIIADYMQKPNSSTVYFEHTLNALPNVFHTIRAHSETFSLLQLCDVLLGSVLFQWKSAMQKYVPPSNRSLAKQAFVEYVISKLDIPIIKQAAFPLAQPIKIHGKVNFSVFTIKENEVL